MKTLGQRVDEVIERYNDLEDDLTLDENFTDEDVMKVQQTRHLFVDEIQEVIRRYTMAGL